MNIKMIPQLLLLLVLLLFFFGGALIDLYVDFLWFQEVGYPNVFLIQLKTQWLVGVGTGIATFLFLWINVRVARRSSRELMLTLENNVLRPPQLEELGPLINRLLPVGLALIALIAGIAGGSLWEHVLLFGEPTPFGTADPLFGHDLAFYVFRVPLLKVVYAYSFVVLGLCFVVVALLHVLDGRVMVSDQAMVLAPRVKPHLLTLLGLMLLVRAGGHMLDQYDLLYSSRGIAYGAGYTDVHVLLPVLKLSLVLAAIGGVLVIISGFRPTWKPTVAAVGLWLLVSFVGQGAAPAIVQKLKVGPNQFNLEKPFIEHSIRFTRAAYNVQSVEERDFSSDETLTAEALAKNDLTVQNIRLWDHRPLLTSYEQLQEIRTYYDFADVDVDRYIIDGKYRQVMLSAREISPDRLPSRLWINERLTYTHGHGVVVSPVNRIMGDGLPDFLVKNIPPTAHPDLKVSRPEIYYGEKTNDYVFVNTRAREFDYPAGESNVYTTYTGTGGVTLLSLARRLAFALHFKSLSLLLSSDITADSRVMFRRRIQERLGAIAPFLSFDRDPYMVISKGRLYWLCDAYTETDRYPYSQPVPGLGNYVRNSVKAVVDAYNGTVNFYLADENDPLIRTYARIFPGLFRPLTAMDADLRTHIRVPPMLFNVQARIYAVYHMTDPQVFFNREDVWEIPAGDVKTIDQETPAPQVGPFSRRRSTGAVRSPVETMEPYYTIMKLLDSPREEFIQLIPFTPARKDNLRAWMCGRNDPPHYGKLLVYNFPKAKTIFGPSQINARIDQEAEISKQLTLWKQGGSHVIRGSLLIIPVDQSLLYVQSLYLKAAQGEIPELKRVITAFGHRIVMESSLEASLRSLLGDGTAPAPAVPPVEKSRPAASEIGPQASGSIHQHLVREALEHLQQARQGYRRDDWARFGDELKKLEETLERLNQAAQSKDKR
jgi:uncharacterized membrane protein (UPF0182 family)